MSKKAGVITIDLFLGTGQFAPAADGARGKLDQISNSARQLGSHGVTGVQAVSGALRVLEGGITNNLRAAERFTANVLGLGPILQAAFPLIGAIAFLGIVDKVGTEVAKFYTQMRDAPEKIAGEFRKLIEPMRLTNDELALTNDRLQNQIAKLEGRPQNTLKLALDEARVAAEKLADALDKDIEKLQKFLKDNESGMAAQVLHGITGGTMGEFSDKGLREEIGGKTGSGGWTLDLAKIEDAGRADLSAAKNQTEAAAARSRLDAALQKKYGEIIAELENQRKTIADSAKAHPTGRLTISGAPEMTLDKSSAATDILEKYTKAIAVYGEMNRSVPLRSEVDKNTATVEGLAIAKENGAELKKLMEESASALGALQRAALRSEAPMLPKSTAAFEDMGKLRGGYGYGLANKDFLAEDTSDVAKGRRSFGQIFSAETIEKAKELSDHFTKLAFEAENLRRTEQNKEVEEGLKKQAKAAEELVKWLRGVNEARFDSQARQASQSSEAQIRLAGVNLGNQKPAEVARQEYGIRLDLAKKEFDIESERIRLTKNGREAEVAQLEAKNKLVLATGQAEIDYALRAAEIQKQQLDAIKTKTESLLHTLFTAPKNFGQQLFTTLRDVSLKPLEENLSKTISAHLAKIAGLAGFGSGKPDGTKSNPIWVTTGGGVFGGGAPSGLGTPGGAVFGGSAGGMIFNLRNFVSGGGADRTTSQRAPDGSGHTVYIGTIDARGSDPELIEQKIGHGITLAMEKTIGASVQVMHDRSRRIPQPAY